MLLDLQACCIRCHPNRSKGQSGRFELGIEKNPRELELVGVGSDIRRIGRAGAVVPRREHRRELGELLHVIWAFNTSALLPACLDRVDQSPEMWLTDSHVPGADVRPHT